MENRFYVYAILDPRKPGNYQYDKYHFNYEPFYIGKGTEARCFDHGTKKDFKRNYNQYKTRKIKKIINQNLKPILLILYNNLSENDSFKFEIELIQIIGRRKEKGPLTNIYDGGFGSTKSEDTRNKISISLKKWYQTHIDTRIGRIVEKSTGEKISKALKGRTMTPIWKERMIQSKLKSEKTKRSKWEVTYPNGETAIVNGIYTFSKEHNLAPSHMIAVASGKRSHHKGFKCKKLN